jgi:hypothetical protein
VRSTSGWRIALCRLDREVDGPDRCVENGGLETEGEQPEDSKGVPLTVWMVESPSTLTWWLIRSVLTLVGMGSVGLFAALDVTDIHRRTGEHRHSTYYVDRDECALALLHR